MGLSLVRSGVEACESIKSLGNPFGVFTAENALAAGVAGAGAALPLTGVKPPELTAVKPPDAMAGLGSSDGVGTASPCSDAFSAAEAFIAGEPFSFAVGVPCFFSGECAGDGVNGPPYSNSSIW